MPRRTQKAKASEGLEHCPDPPAARKLIKYARSNGGRSTTRGEPGGGPVRGAAMNLSSLPVTHQTVIPEDFIDEFGHMNVMWYTHLFTEAAGGLFQRVGMTREHFTTNQTGSFALEQH